MAKELVKNKAAKHIHNREISAIRVNTQEIRKNTSVCMVKKSYKNEEGTGQLASIYYLS